MPIQDHLAELEALARLAHTLVTATAGDESPGVHAMAQALALRLKTLATGVRLASDPLSPAPPAPSETPS